MRNQLLKPNNFLRVLFKTPKFILFFLLINFYYAQAQTYPFPLPSTLNATLNVETQNQETFNNLLLGYNIFGYSTEDEKAFMRRMDPITVRFPHGLWANWYDWRDDGTKVFGTDSFQYIHRGDQLKWVTLDHLTSIKYFDDSNAKVGIDGLTTLNNEKKSANGGKGYDMLWTFNMSADGTDFSKSPETVARYKNLKSRGLEVKAIELGNENFYPGQRSSIIPNAAEYILRAKNMSQTLKSQDPNIQVSIPLLRRGSYVNPSWNEDLTQDLSYFDAITVHTYIGADPDNSANSEESYGVALTARDKLQSSTDDFARVYAPNKPVWLSEWGVKSGGPNAASVLGMADSYLFMSENQNIYQRANWFSVNGKLNSFLVWENYVDGNGDTKQRIKQPYIKTANGSTYEILRAVFENSTMLESNMNTATLEGNTKAVSGRAVTKNGETMVFVLNMTSKPANFTLKFNGSTYNKSFKHEAMKFTSLSQERAIPIDQDPLALVKEGTGQITLPPFSINVISNLNVSTPDPTGNQTPYTWAQNVPGVIEAESYDKGGEGVAYHDTSIGNSGNSFRTDNVDVGSISGGGNFVGWTDNGEWLEYRVNVQASGNYNMIITYSAAGSTAKIGASLPDEGITLFTGVDLAQTAGWTDYKTRTKYGVPLTAGYQILRLTIEEKGFNIDKIEFVEPFGGLSTNSNLTEGKLRSIDTDKITIYPNPSETGIFTITTTGKWTVYNLSGVKVLEGKGEKVDLSGLSNGFYSIHTEKSKHKIIIK